jgi:DNA-binding response OmpR family regulator
VDVTVLHWPADEVARARLAAQGMPRVLVISPSSAPPPSADALEDWVREPVRDDELAARVATLAERARIGAHRPRVDDTGAVWVGRRSVALPAVQQPVVRLLVARFAQLVPAAEIAAAYSEAGGSTHPKAVKAMIGRVRSRVGTLDLTLTNVRNRGYLLGPAGNGDPTG